MKPLSKQKSATIYQPTKLYLEDLERIYSIISEITDRISLRNDDFEFENLQDLQKIKIPDVTNLKFIGFKNGLSEFMLFIYPKLIYIDAERDEPALLGVIEKVKEIIRSRKRPLLLSLPTGIVISIVGLIPAIVAIVLLALSINLAIVIRSLIAVSLILNIYTISQLFIRKNQIVLKYSKESPSFWERNKDKIIVGIISSVGTFILTFLLKMVTCPKP